MFQFSGGDTTRIEKDLIGEMPVDNSAYYGIHTKRAVENFQITGVPVSHYPDFVTALAMVKKACAMTNRELGLLDDQIAWAICKACDDIIEGEYHSFFVVDMIQGGAGTSTNMNTNEVIANIALEIIGKSKGQYEFIDPNNHVNLSQSTNDVYPTAIRLACLISYPKLVSALEVLIKSFHDKGHEYQDVIKLGRTQLQDAVPISVQQEFAAYAATVKEDIQRIMDAAELFKEVNLGGTAVGTGINTHPDYRSLVIQNLSKVTSIDFCSSSDLVEASYDPGAFVTFSGIMKRISVKISKICNDLRLLSSGPRSGLGEITLPAMQAGSSIMPGKVNPVIPEAFNQVAFQAIGNDLAITMAAESGQLQLNAFEPIIAFNLFQSINILTRSITQLSEKCILGIVVNEKRCRENLENSLAIVTALNPHIGYQASSAIAKKALTTGKKVTEVIVEEGVLTAEQIDELLQPKHLLQPRRIG